MEIFTDATQQGGAGIESEEVNMKLNVGDRVRYKKNGLIYEGSIKSINGGRIEIDNDTIKLIVQSIPEAS